MFLCSTTLDFFIKYGVCISGRLPNLRAVILTDIFRSRQQNFEIVL